MILRIAKLETTVVIPAASRMAGFSMPDDSRSCGVLTTPTQTTTGFK
jgi:hypothetical protein